MPLHKTHHVMALLSKSIPTTSEMSKTELVLHPATIFVSYNTRLKPSEFDIIDIENFVLLQFSNYSNQSHGHKIENKTPRIFLPIKTLKINPRSLIHVQ